MEESKFMKKRKPLKPTLVRFTISFRVPTRRVKGKLKPVLPKLWQEDKSTVTLDFTGPPLSDQEEIEAIRQAIK